MKSLAIEQQQCFYEILPEWIEYKSDEHKYLQQNIGFAIFGLPMNNEKASATESNSCYWKSENSNDTDADVTDTVNYDAKAKNVIDIIYSKIRECTIGTNNTDNEPICFGIIYNVIFRPEMNVKSKKKEVKNEVKKETKTEVKESVKEDEEKEFALIPIFKIKRNIQKKSDTAKSTKQKENTTKVEADYEIWYIDTCGRVYKSWKDYMEENNLPKCTMVLPKGGFYQADLSYPITEDYSTVWLEVIDSPACKWTAKISNGIDVISNIAGISTVVISVASLFTPLAPAVAVTGKLSQDVIDVISICHMC